MSQPQSQKKPQVKETLLAIQLKADGNMKIERVQTTNGFVMVRELFADDNADLCLSKLEQYLRHLRLSGGQI